VSIGRIGLVVSALFAGVLGVATLVGLVHAIAAFASVVLLFVGGANQWYAGGRPPSQPPDPPPGRWPGEAPDQRPSSRQKDKPPVW